LSVLPGNLRAILAHLQENIIREKFGYKEFACISLELSELAQERTLLVTPLPMKLNNNLLFFSTYMTALKIGLKVVQPPHSATLTAPHQTCE
jgi:hypothetical protein